MPQQSVEYKVIVYREGILGSIFLAGSKVDPERFAEFLNRNAREGWRVVTMERESRRTLGFWSREAFLVILERPVGAPSSSSSPSSPSVERAGPSRL